MKKILLCTLTIAFLISNGFAKSDESMQLYENNPKQTNKEFKKCLKNKTKNEFCEAIKDLKTQQDVKIYEENPKELDKKLKFCEENRWELSDFEKNECYNAKKAEYERKVMLYRQNPKELEMTLKKHCPAYFRYAPNLDDTTDNECKAACRAIRLEIIYNEDIKKQLTESCKNYSTNPLHRRPYPSLKTAVECTVLNGLL